MNLMQPQWRKAQLTEAQVWHSGEIALRKRKTKTNKQQQQNSWNTKSQFLFFPLLPMYVICMATEQSGKSCFRRQCQRAVPTLCRVRGPICSSLCVDHFNFLPITPDCSATDAHTHLAYIDVYIQVAQERLWDLEPHAWQKNAPVVSQTHHQGCALDQPFGRPPMHC